MNHVQLSKNMIADLLYGLVFANIIDIYDNRCRYQELTEDVFGNMDPDCKWDYQITSNIKVKSDNTQILG